MRCRTCDYRLWNLLSRRCPECGSAFRPSEFEFVPGSVQFCCPQCDQPYYATDAKGHLEPKAFACVKCGLDLDMDAMGLRPTAGIEEEQTKADHLPWLDRDRRGRIKAWFATVWMAMTAPGRLIRLSPTDLDNDRAWEFATVTNAVAGFVAFAPMLLLFSFGLMGGMGGSRVCTILGGAVVSFLIVIVVSLIYIALWGLAVRALLRITGGVDGELGHTYQALCYSAGANAVSGIPCVGYYFGFLWWMISAVFMVKERHKIHGGRAAFAVLTPPLLVIAGLIAIYVATLSSMMSTMSTAATSQPALLTTTQPQTQPTTQPTTQPVLIEILPTF